MEIKQITLTELEKNNNLIKEYHYKSKTFLTINNNKFLFLDNNLIEYVLIYKNKDFPHSMEFYCKDIKQVDEYLSSIIKLYQNLKTLEYYQIYKIIVK